MSRRLVNLSEIPGAFHLPRPNWEVIRAWVEQHIAEPDRPSAWADVAFEWLDALNKALDDSYRTEQGLNLLLFAPRDYADTMPLLRSAESVLEAIVEKLGDVAGEGWLGPLVILLFADEQTYYTYTSQANPGDGEPGGSVGACVRSERYVHIALQPSSVSALERTLIHQIAHACLPHLNLPLWLEEGITLLADELRWRQFTLDRETAEEVSEYWRERGLQGFWWGTAFSLPDEGQWSSYKLAEILMHQIVADHGTRLPAFVRRAQADDAGESAARDFLV